MKPLLLLVLSLALVAGNLSAQESPTPANTTPDNTSAPAGGKHKHHKHPDFLAQIKLTPTQKAQIAQIKQSTADHKEQHKEIKALLTPDQLAQLKQLKDQWKAQQSK